MHSACPSVLNTDTPDYHLALSNDRGDDSIVSCSPIKAMNIAITPLPALRHNLRVSGSAYFHSVQAREYRP